MNMNIKDGEVTYVKGHGYEIETENGRVFLVPLTGGDTAGADVEYSDYRYSHGGHIYCADVDRAKKIEKVRIERCET